MHFKQRDTFLSTGINQVLVSFFFSFFIYLSETFLNQHKLGIFLRRYEIEYQIKTQFQRTKLNFKHFCKAYVFELETCDLEVTEPHLSM